jgi:tRNA-splicing ligase RtcB
VRGPKRIAGPDPLKRTLPRHTTTPRFCTHGSLLGSRLDPLGAQQPRCLAERQRLKQFENREREPSMLTIEEPGRVPIKLWTDGVPPVEPQAMQQLRNLASLPFVSPHVAVMPDVHLGIGATVGSVIPTRGAICPASVGVDIGCGVDWVQTELRASQLPDNLEKFRSALEAAIPHGRTNRGGAGDKGAWKKPPPDVVEAWSKLAPEYRHLTQASSKLSGVATIAQLGTMGGGNHFCELTIDETDRVGIMVHSGSRGIGNRIGSVYIAAAKAELERNDVHLPDQDLAFLSEGSAVFDEYWRALSWAQSFARVSRGLMLKRALDVLGRHVLTPVVSARAVSCHHNYVSTETHYGLERYVTRKGALSARAGELGVIPGAMGRRSFVVRGKGNPESLCSCSHGAGRLMSRGQAKRSITLAQHLADTAGLACRKDVDVLDESPRAYKDIDAVMASQADLVEIVHTLRAVVCVKG